MNPIKDAQSSKQMQNKAQEIPSKLKKEREREKKKQKKKSLACSVAYLEWACRLVDRSWHHTVLNVAGTFASNLACAARELIIMQI